jgi:hypothetical protein
MFMSKFVRCVEPVICAIHRRSLAGYKQHGVFLLAGSTLLANPSPFKKKDVSCIPCSVIPSLANGWLRHSV